MINITKKIHNKEDYQKRFFLLKCKYVWFDTDTNLTIFVKFIIVGTLFNHTIDMDWS